MFSGIKNVLYKIIYALWIRLAMEEMIDFLSCPSDEAEEPAL